MPLDQSMIVEWSPVTSEDVLVLCEDFPTFRDIGWSDGVEHVTQLMGSQSGSENKTFGRNGPGCRNVAQVEEDWR